MDKDITVLEKEDIENALDAGKMITPESARRVLSQSEIDNIVNAYNGLKSTQALISDLLNMANKLNESDDTRTEFTVKCAEAFPSILKTMESLR